MRKLLGMALVVCTLVAVPVFGQDPDTRAILEKAIKAHGGEKVLNIKAFHSRSKGKLHLGQGADFTSEEDAQFPDKFHTAITFDVGGKSIAVTQAFDGTQGWISVMGKTIDMDDQLKTEMKEQLHSARVSNLVDVLRDKKFKLAALGEAKVKDKDAIGIRVSFEGRRDVNLFFDKGSWLLVKSEGRALDPISKQEVNQEKFFSDYHEKDGHKVPRKIDVTYDGKLFVEAEIVEVQLLEKLDDSMFKRP